MRPILRGKATLSEIETHYSILDLADLNEAMDLEEEAERLASLMHKKGSS